MKLRLHVDAAMLHRYRVAITRTETRYWMSFLRRLFGGGAKPAGDHALHLYVKCSRCGSAVHVRVDLYNDLSSDYGDTDAEGYTLFKEIMDDRCFRLMRATIQFDARRNETSREVEGGTFISEAEYEESRAARAQAKAAAEQQPPL